MIRPAEIRALVDLLLAGDEAHRSLAESIKKGISRLWGNIEIAPSQMMARATFHNNGEIYVDVFWREILVFSVHQEDVIRRDSRFLVNVNDGRFSVRRFTADDWPELVVHPPA